MEASNLNEKESLELISQMIRNSRRKLEDGNGIPFLIWGYTTFFVSMLVFFLVNAKGNYHYYWFWFLIPVIGSAGMFLSGKSIKKHARNYIDRVIGNIWFVTGIAAFLLSFCAIYFRIPILTTMFLIMGMGTALTGLVIKFKPLIISGFIGMASCIVPFIIQGNEQIIVFGVIYLAMTVIPGHILNYKGKRKDV
jgi:hypothetical protein